MTERGIREAFSREGRITRCSCSPSTWISPFPRPGPARRLKDLFHQRYGANRIDLLICVDVPAATWWVRRHLFPGVPVILCSAPTPGRILASPLGDRVSGVLEPASQARGLVRSALTLKPDTRHAVLISGTFENDQAQAIALRAALEALRPGVELIDLSGRPLGDILAACEQLPPHTLIFFSTLFVDGRGRSRCPRPCSESIAAGRPRRRYSAYEPFMGHGIVGGCASFPAQAGRAAARKAVRLLLGEEQPRGRVRLRRVHDRHPLRLAPAQAPCHREGLVPDQASILFHEATLWDQYKQAIIGVALLLAFQTLLIVGLIVNLRHRKLAEEALRQRELQTLAGRLISSQEEELSGCRAGIPRRLRPAAGRLPSRPAPWRSRPNGATPLRERIPAIQGQLINLSDDIHALGNCTRPSSGSRPGARAQRALPGFRRPGRDRSGRVSSQYPRTSTRRPPCASTGSSRRAAQHRQTRPRPPRRHLQPRGSRLQATIEDDGVGFEPKYARHTPGIGPGQHARAGAVRPRRVHPLNPNQGTARSTCPCRFRGTMAKNPAGR